MDNYTPKPQYGARFGFRTPPPEFAREAVEPLSPLAAAPTIPRDAPLTSIFASVSPFAPITSLGRHFFNHSSNMSPSTPGFPTPPIYSAAASTNPMLAFADIALAYSPSLFSTPRTSNFATTQVASSSASFSPSTAIGSPSPAVNTVNGARHDQLSYPRLPEAPPSSLSSRPAPDNNPTFSAPVDRPEVASGTSRAWPTESPFRYPEISAAQGFKYSSKRGRKTMGDSPTRADAASGPTSRPTYGDQGYGSGRGNSASCGSRWSHSGPASDFLEPHSRTFQSLPIATHPLPTGVEPPSPSPAYSPYPSRPATPATGLPDLGAPVYSSYGQSSDVNRGYTQFHAGGYEGRPPGGEPDIPRWAGFTATTGKGRDSPGLAPHILSTIKESKIEYQAPSNDFGGNVPRENIGSAPSGATFETAAEFNTQGAAPQGVKPLPSPQPPTESLPPASTVIDVTSGKDSGISEVSTVVEVLDARNINSASDREEAVDARFTPSKTGPPSEGGAMVLDTTGNLTFVTGGHGSSALQEAQSNEIAAVNGVEESRDAIAEPEPPAMPQDLVNGSSVAEVGPSGSDSRVVEDDEPVGAVNYPDLNRVIRQESEDYELEKPVGDEPVFGADSTAEIGIPQDIIHPEEQAARENEPPPTTQEQEKVDDLEDKELRVLSPTGESSREPQNPSDEKCETCQGPYQDGHGFRFDQIAWIGCDGCGSWHHSRCVGLDAEMVNKIDKFHCTKCTEAHGPSTMKRKSGRATTAIDYNALHNGSTAPIKNPLDGKLHPYVAIIRNRAFNFADDKLPRMRPEQVTVEFLEDLPNGWNQPFIVPAESNPAPWNLPPKTASPNSIDGATPHSPPPEGTYVLTTPPPPPLATHRERVGDRSATPGPASAGEGSTPEMTLDNGDFDPAEVNRLKRTLRVGEYDVKERRPGADNLDMVIPSGLTVRKVSELIGETARVEMINVLSQATEKDDKWQMEQLVNYFESDVRDVIYNCISCEVSNSELGSMISRPQVVRDLDLADKVWRPDPAPLVGPEAKPRVGKYILMSVEDSFTDFHIDFAGSSVFYHIYEGEKVFLVIPPTDHNLEVYEKWSMDPNMNTTFFPTLVSDPCTLVTLNKGDTLFIPSGWIHAVYTPKDSLVVGGNFLTRNHYTMQMKIQRIEVTTDTKISQRYPKYTTLMWHLAYNYMSEDPISEEVDEALGQGRVLKRSKGRPSKGSRSYTNQELEGLPALCNFLLRTALVHCGSVVTSLVPRKPNLTTKQIDAVKRAIPAPINQDPVEWAKKFGRWCVWKRACLRLVPNGERVPEWALESWWPKDGPKKGPSQAALRRAQRLREEEARKAEPPRRPGLRIRTYRADSTPGLSGSENSQEEGRAPSSKGRSKKRAPEPDLPGSGPPKKRGRPPNKAGEGQQLSRRKSITIEEDGEAFTLSDGCIYVRKLSNLGPPRAGCQNCRLKKTGCKHKPEIADLLARLEAGDKIPRLDPKDQSGSGATEQVTGPGGETRVEQALAPAPTIDGNSQGIPGEESATPGVNSTLKRALPPDGEYTEDGVAKKQKLSLPARRPGNPTPNRRPAIQSLAGGRPPGFQGRKPSCERCKELKAKCPHDTWHLAIKKLTKAGAIDPKRSGGKSSHSKTPTKPVWDGAARESSVPRRHSTTGGVPLEQEQQTPEADESVLEDIIVVSRHPPPRLPVPEVRIFTEKPLPEGAKSSSPAPEGAMAPRLPPPPPDVISTAPDATATPATVDPPPIANTPEGAVGSPIAKEKDSLDLDLSVLEQLEYKPGSSATSEDPSIMAPPLDDIDENSPKVSTATTTILVAPLPPPPPPPTTTTPAPRSNGIAITPPQMSDAKKVDYPKLSQRAPKPRVIYTKTTKTVKNRADDDESRYHPYNNKRSPRFGSSLSPGGSGRVGSGVGVAGGAGTGAGTGTGAPDEEIGVEELKRMAAKQEFGLRDRRAS